MVCIGGVCLECDTIYVYICTKIKENKIIKITNIKNPLYSGFSFIYNQKSLIFIYFLILSAIRITKAQLAHIKGDDKMHLQSITTTQELQLNKPKVSINSVAQRKNKETTKTNGEKVLEEMMKKTKETRELIWGQWGDSWRDAYHI